MPNFRARGFLGGSHANARQSEDTVQCSRVCYPTRFRMECDGNCHKPGWITMVLCALPLLALMIVRREGGVSLPLLW